MKRLLVILMLIVCVSVPLSSSYAAGGYVWKADVSVNIRDAPWGGNIIGVVNAGRCVTVVYESSNRVGIRMPNGKIGYLHKPYLHIAHAEEIEEDEKRKSKHIKITNEDAFAIGRITETCNVYKKPNEKVIGKYEKGDEIYIRKIDKYWVRVIWQNKEVAAIQSKYVDFVRPNIPIDGEYEYRKVISNAKIYEAPNYKSQKIGKVVKGHYVYVIDDSDEKYAYVCFSTEGKFGYIYKKHLK